MEVEPEGAYVNTEFIENPLSSKLRLVMSLLAASTVFTVIFAVVTWNQIHVSQAIRPKTRLLGENVQTQNYCRYSG